MIPASASHAASGAKAPGVVWLVTIAWAIFWTCCFLRIGHFFQRLGVAEVNEVLMLLLKPFFSVGYFALGLVAKRIAIGAGRTGFGLWLLIYNCAYPCLTIALVCCQMGRIDLAMGN